MSWSLSIKTPFLIDLQEFFIYSGDGSSVDYSQFSIFSKSCSMWSPGTLTQLSWIIVDTHIFLLFFSIIIYLRRWDIVPCAI